MLRHVKIILVWTVALWAFLGSLHNILDWNGTFGAVSAVTSMATFDGGSDSWQATSHPIILWAGALFIVLSKIAAAIMCSIGGFKMWQAKAQTSNNFNQAKEIALAGCAVLLIMLFGGFIVIAESWYELWRSDVMRGPVLETAFRYAGLISLIAIFVASKDD